MSTRMRLILPVALLLWALSAEAKEPAATVEVTARLVKIPGKFPPDELYDYAYVMQYQVQGGPLDQQNILVAHYKPRRPRAEIDDGDTVVEPIADVERSAVRAYNRSHRRVTGGDAVDDFQFSEVNDAPPALRRGTGDEQLLFIRRKDQSRRRIRHDDGAGNFPAGGIKT